MRLNQLCYSFFKTTFPFLGTVFLLFSLWELLVDFFRIPSFILPSPFEVLILIYGEHTYFLHHGGITFFESAFGLAIAIVIGFFCSVEMVFLGRRAQTTLLPIIAALQAIPVVALAPLLVLWFGIGSFSKISLVAILCWFPIVINTTRGLTSIRRDQLDLMRSFHATRWQLFFHLRLPLSVPFILAGIRVAAGLSVIGAIVAEYSGANAGLGYIITQSSYRLDTPRLFGAIFVAALESLLLYNILLFLESKIFHKYAVESG
jgi:ABC-type nitrate/sulfonate/bicarbonate transport system permease component